MTLLYSKDSKLYCGHCGDHILTLSQDAYIGTALGPALLKDEGQGPWKYGDKTCCRKCGEPFFNGVKFLGIIKKGIKDENTNRTSTNNRRKNT